MEFARYFRILRKWLWLIITAAFVGGGVSFILTTRQVPVYTAHSIISIGQYMENPNPNPNEIYIGMNLVQTYQQLVQTRDILQGVVTDLKLSFPPEALRGLISTEVIPSTSLLTISVRYIDPILASDIANSLANQLILQSPTNLTVEQQAQVDLANAQITDLTTQITTQRALATSLEQQMATTTDKTQLNALKDQHSGLIAQINDAAGTIAQFQGTIASFQQRANALTIVERAVIPTFAAGTNATSLTVLGTVAGAVLALGLTFTLEYFDDKIRTTETATQLLALPVLGAIPKFGKKNDPYTARLITNFPSLSSVTEAYRKLRTNLVFMASSDNQNVFVVTSSGPGEGKSVTTANLAATMAFAGMRVLLIDADLRRPIVHEIFGLENTVGLSTLLFVEPNSNDKKEPTDVEDKTINSLNQCLQTTQIPNLKVITSGFIPSNPSEILGSVLMKRWVEAFRTSSNIDVVIIDTPPATMFADSAILAAVVNAAVIFVVDSENTRRSAALKGQEALRQVGIEMKGVVVNRINPRDEAAYYDNYYYRNYYTRDAKPKRGLLRFRR
ncbi:MAG: polysaccharide biosynthesis tyrosine autokinase [Chloroflexota bacterium]